MGASKKTFTHERMMMADRSDYFTKVDGGYLSFMTGEIIDSEGLVPYTPEQRLEDVWESRVDHMADQRDKTGFY